MNGINGMVLLLALPSVIISASLPNDDKQECEGVIYEQPHCVHVLHHFDVVNSVRFNQNGTRVVSASCDGFAKVWDIHDGRLLLSLYHNGHKVADAWFSNDGRHIITYVLGQVHPWSYWNSRNGFFEGAYSRPSDICPYAGPSRASQDDMLFCDDRSILIRDGKTNRVLYTLNGHKKIVKAAQYNHEGTKIVSGAADGTVRIWHVGKTLQDAVNAEYSKRMMQYEKGRRALVALQDIFG